MAYCDKNSFHKAASMSVILPNVTTVSRPCSWQPHSHCLVIVPLFRSSKRCLMPSKPAGKNRRLPSKHLSSKHYCRMQTSFINADTIAEASKYGVGSCQV